MTPLELWGGVECAPSASATRYRDQLRETGHFERDSDLEAMAALGIRTVRYPILWDTVAPERRQPRLQLARRSAWRSSAQLGIRVIGGLVHHGSGPRHTSVLDPDLPARLGRLRRQGRRALSVDRYLGPGQRAADHCALRLPLRPLVPAQQRHRRHVPRAGPPVRRHSRGDARYPRGQSRGAADGHRGSRQDLRDPAVVASGASTRTPPLASLDLLAGRRRPRSSATRDARTCRHVGRARCAPSDAGDAKPDLIGVDHYLTSERYLDHRRRALSGCRSGRQRPAGLCRR